MCRVFPGYVAHEKWGNIGDFQIEDLGRTMTDRMFGFDMLESIADFRLLFENL